MNYRIFLTLFSLSIVLSIAMIWHTKNIQHNAVVFSALQSAKLYSDAISTFRAIYSAEVFSIANKNELHATQNHENVNSLPLPATLTMMIADEINSRGIGEEVYLYSPYPFPWRKETGGLRDEFSKRAWKHLLDNTSKPYYEVITTKNNKYLRFASADIMRPSCINCHNANSNSPKNNWKEGDLRGVLDIKIPLEDILTETEKDLKLSIATYAVIAVFGVLGLFFIISKHKNESKQLEIEVKNRTIELEQEKSNAIKANNAKSEFLSSMSHELRTPLNAIMGYAQLLEIDEMLDAQHRESAQEIQRAGTHLHELVVEVLDLAKIESGKVELSIESVSMFRIIQECLKILEPMAKNKNIKIDVDDYTKIYVKADRVRLKQALINLMSNAIKYNQENGNVYVTSRGVNNNYLCIEVRDTGLGIDQDKLDNVFMPFDRLGHENSNIDGTGIGLAISKTLIELMGGEIGVDSKKGAGSTFWLTLPLSSGIAVDVSNKSVEIIDVVEHGQITEEKTILYIEDNYQNIKLMTKIIDRVRNINLLTAHLPGLGLEMLAMHKVDLILLDINMPEMDGYRLLKEIKSNHGCLSIPIFAVTASAMAQDIEKGNEAGFDEYITKPFDIKKLITLFEKYLK